MEFTTYRFKDCIAEIIDNRGRNPDKYYDSEKYPVIDNYLIKNELHPVVENANRFLSQSQFDNFLRGYVTKDDLLMTLVGNGIGNVSLSPNDKIAIVQNTVGFRLNQELLDSHFAFYYFKTINSAVRNLDRGASQPSVNRTDVLRLKIQVPTINTQKQIANVLSTYDKLIENNNKRIKLLEQMAENLYKEWFVRFRFPGYENSEFVDGIPSNWRKGKIKEFITFLNGFAFSSDDYNDDGEYGIVTIKNVQDGFFADENVEHIVKIPSRMPDYCCLNIGDTLISLTGNVGRVCMVTGDNFLLNQRVAKIQSKYPYYTYNFFRQESIYLSLCNIAYGTAQLNLSPILASNLKVIIPNEEIVKRYNKFVKPIYDFIQKVNVENKNLKKQRDLLLPRLMSGKLEV